MCVLLWEWIEGIFEFYYVINCLIFMVVFDLLYNNSVFNILKYIINMFFNLVLGFLLMNVINVIFFCLKGYFYIRGF